MGSELLMFHFQEALCKSFPKLSFESLLMRAAFIMAALSRLCEFSMCLPMSKGLLWLVSADCFYLTYSIRGLEPHSLDRWGYRVGWWGGRWTRERVQATFSHWLNRLCHFFPTLIFWTAPTSHGNSSSLGGRLYHHLCLQVFVYVVVYDRISFFVKSK
jgi:hypothetical protein